MHAKEALGNMSARQTRSDLTYRLDAGSMWVRFYPETEAGECAWREMAKADGVAAVLPMHLPSVLAQLKAAGYVVRQDRSKLPSVDDVLAELDA